MTKKRFVTKTFFKIKTISPARTILKPSKKKQAAIDGIVYYSLEAAIRSVNTTEPKVIKLLSNVNLHNSSIYISRRKNIILDLAGFRITSHNNDGTIYLEGSLTIQDSSSAKSGLIENTYTNGMGIYFYRSGCLNQYGGTIRGYCALYSWNDFFSPVVTIDGGIIDGKYFGISFRNIENLTVKRGIIRGGVMACNVWSSK